MALEDIHAYFRNYDREAFAIFACQGNEPSESDIAAFESSVGIRLPDEFRRFTMSSLGGLSMEVKEALWPRAQAYASGPFWSFLYGFQVFGIAKDIPAFLDIRVQAAEMSAAGHADLIPILQRLGDANKYCIEASGKIVEWSYEEPDERRLIEESFSELLLREIRELEVRKDRKLRGEDKPKPAVKRSYDGNQPCPQCGKPLRTNSAKQCFACGANWHEKRQ